MVGGSPYVAPLMLIIILAAVMVLFVPLSPSLSVTFNLGVSSTGYGPTLTAETWSYAKVTLGSSSGVAKGSISLSFAGSSLAGPYNLTIAVSYNGQSLSGPEKYAGVGEGTYQTRIVYWPRTESTDIPYVVTITAAETGAPSVMLMINILPT